MAAASKYTHEFGKISEIISRLTPVRTFSIVSRINVAKELKASRKSGPVRRCHAGQTAESAEIADMTERIKTADGRKHPDPLILVITVGRMLARILGPPGPLRLPFRGEVS